MELGLSTRQQVFGEKSIELREGCRKYARFCNQLVMESFSKRNVPQMLHYLKRGEQFSGACTLELMEAYKTLAEIYKEKDVRLALHFLQNVPQKDAHLTSDTQKVSFIQVHLSICALLSRIGQHSKALTHAQMALSCLENNFRPKIDVTTETSSKSTSMQPRRAFKSNISLPIKKVKSAPQPKRSKSMLESPSSMDNSVSEAVGLLPRTCQEDHHSVSPLVDQLSSNIYILLGIAYFNIGTQLEFLKDFQSSLQSYRRGEAAFRVIGRLDHPVLYSLKTSRLQLERAIVNT